MVGNSCRRESGCSRNQARSRPAVGAGAVGLWVSWATLTNLPEPGILKTTHASAFTAWRSNCQYGQRSLCRLQGTICLLPSPASRAASRAVCFVRCGSLCLQSHGWAGVLNIFTSISAPVTPSAVLTFPLLLSCESRANRDSPDNLLLPPPFPTPRRFLI